MKHELSYWEDLAERYFSAETTDEEEALLRKFLCTDEARDSRFDEVRATMAFLYIASPFPSKGGVNQAAPFPPPLEGLGEALPQRGSGEGARPLGLFLAAIAASLCIAFFLGWYQYKQYNISSVRVAGENVEADASLLMQRQMAEMFNTPDHSDR